MIALYGIVCFFAGVGFGCWGTAVFLSNRDDKGHFTETLVMATISVIIVVFFGSAAVAVILKAAP